MDLGKIDALPKMVGFRAEGAQIVRGHVVENPDTIATAIQVEILQVGSLQKRLEMSLRGTLVWCLMN